MRPFHARVADELAAIEPQDALERQQWQQACDWVASGAELCRLHKPATPAQHLVSYFVLDDGQHLLLVDHHNAGLWLPTGGHVDPGEHPRATVQRELQEELGLALPAPVGPPLMLTIGTTVGLTAGHTDVSLWYRVPARGVISHCTGTAASLPTCAGSRSISCRWPDASRSCNGMWRACGRRTHACRRERRLSHAQPPAALAL